MTTRLFLCFLAFVLFSCSSDTLVEEEEEVVEEVLSVEEALDKTLSEVKPHWDDGVITIQIGRHRTGADLLRSLKKNNIYFEYFLKRDLPEPKFYMSGRRYEIDVAVITMREIGFNELTSVYDIVDRFVEKGYRTLTPEEAIELRLQFLDQPELSEGHRMAAFHILVDQEKVINYHPDERYFMFAMYNSKKQETPRGIMKNPARKKFPNNAHPDGSIMRHTFPTAFKGMRFAVVQDERE